MEWTVREEDGFDVGEETDDSMLMKKTISIPACKAIHNVVSYYTAWDARTLARPSRSTMIRPELASIFAEKKKKKNKEEEGEGRRRGRKKKKKR